MTPCRGDRRWVLCAHWARVVLIIPADETEKLTVEFRHSCLTAFRRGSEICCIQPGAHFEPRLGCNWRCLCLLALHHVTVDRSELNQVNGPQLLGVTGAIIAVDFAMGYAKRFSHQNNDNKMEKT
jgi:hypothetical protein